VKEYWLYGAGLMFVEGVDELQAVYGLLTPAHQDILPHWVKVGITILIIAGIFVKRRLKKKRNEA